VKNTKLLVTVILIVLVVFGIFSIILSNVKSGKKDYNEALSLAENYMSRGLYQLAIEEYDKAIAVKDSEELRNAVLDAYAKRYEESTGILDNYITAAENAVAAFKKNESYYTILIKLYGINDDYQSAYKVLDKAIKGGLKTDTIMSLYAKVKYAFDAGWYTYMHILSGTNGFYPVGNSSLWGLIDETGSNKANLLYNFVSQVGDEGVRILAGDENTLVDGKGVVRGKLSFVPTAAGIYSEGLIAIKNDKTYGYYDSLGDYKFGKYLAASNFTNGKAAVSEKEGTWQIIDKDGKAVSDTTYKDVKLNADGSYIKKGVMVAKTDDKYKLYDKKGKQIGNFECDDIDVVTDDGLIAFKKDGKWGFVNTSGKVVIDAAFDSAKSFSNGLAGVCSGEKWGFIDESGTVVIDYQFYGVDYFNSKRYCLVKGTPGDWELIGLKVKF
jgi:hypothetical protein